MDITMKTLKEIALVLLASFSTLVASMFVLASGHLVVGLVMIGVVTFAVLAYLLVITMVYNYLKEE